MDDSTRELLVKRIESEFKNLNTMSYDDDYKQDTVDNLIAFYKLKIEEEKIDNELNKQINDCDLEKIRQEVESKDRTQELEMKKAQLNEQKIDRWVNVGMQIGLSMLSIFAYDIWNRRGLKFEETGTITSPMTRNLFSKMLPKR